MTLATQAVEVLTSKRTQALATYRALASREHDPQPGDAELLADVLTRLERTPEEFQDDVFALRKADDLRSKIKSAAEMKEIQEQSSAQMAELDQQATDALCTFIRGLEPVGIYTLISQYMPVTERDALLGHRKEAQFLASEVARGNERCMAQLKTLQAQHPVMFGDTSAATK